MPTPDGPEPPDRPLVSLVTPRRRVEPVLVATVLCLTLVGLALWKPWDGRIGETSAPAAPTQAAPMPNATA